MKKLIKAKDFILGFVTCALVIALAMGVFAALPPTTKKTVDIYYGYDVYVDGVKFEPSDKNGVIEAFNYGGWIYAPFEHIAKAIGKVAYWDGPNRSLYLGNMDGKLEYPSLRFEDATNIGNKIQKADSNADNYGNIYASAYSLAGGNSNYHVILNMKYSRFKGTLYVAEGTTDNGSGRITIEIDGKFVYTSPDITKSTAPIYIDMDVSGAREFKIIQSGDFTIRFGDAGFYQ